MISIGVDPGLAGAIAVYDARARAVSAFLELRQFVRGRELDLAPILRHYTVFERGVVVIEKPSAMPASPTGQKGQGVASAFNFGFTCGGLVGLFTGMGFRVIEKRPAAWKGELGVPADKRATCILAGEKFPGLSFFGPRGGPRDGLAEACFLALYGVRFLKRISSADDLCS